LFINNLELTIRLRATEFVQFLRKNDFEDTP
jgi:hypothetical protein